MKWTLLPTLFFFSAFAAGAIGGQTERALDYHGVPIGSCS
jgi:hypothetical protein